MKKFLLTAAVIASGAAIAGAETVDGINYTLDATAKTASVSSGEYSGEVVIPETITVDDETYAVTSVAKSAFSGVEGVTSIVLPMNCRTINIWAFWGCADLERIDMGGTNDIKSQAFEDCFKLKEMTLRDPDVVCYATANAIPDAIAAQLILHVPSKDMVTRYCQQNYYWYDVYAILDPTQTTDGTLCYQTYEDGTAMVLAPYTLAPVTGYYGNSATRIGPDVEVPSSVSLNGRDYTVTNLEAGVFYATSNVRNVTFNEGLTNIEYETFYASMMEEIVFPNSLENLAYNNFYSCGPIKSVTFGTGFKTIGANCFYNCPNLTDITLLCLVPPTLDPESAAGTVIPAATKANVTLHVPAGTVEDYRNSDIWGGFKDYVELPGDPTGITGITANGYETVRYFNLSGVEIASPEKGQIVIEVRGGKAVKTVVR